MTFSSTLELLLYSSLIVWIFPAFRQYRGRFFLFFLVIACGDPIMFALVILFNFNLGPVAPLIISFFMTISIVYIVSEKVLTKIFIGVFGLFILLPFIITSYKVYYILIVVLHVFIFYKILIFFVKKNIDEKSINLFYLIILLYELLNIFKVSNLVIGITNAYEFHVLTTIFQVALGLYFSIFRENSPRNFIKF